MYSDFFAPIYIDISYPFSANILDFVNFGGKVNTSGIAVVRATYVHMAPHHKHNNINNKGGAN